MYATTANIIDHVKTTVSASIARSGITITEKKINIEPDHSLRIVCVQRYVYAFYSSKTDQTTFYNIDIAA